MSDREKSPAYLALPDGSRKVFAAIEKAVGDGSSASVSYEDFMLDYHVPRKAILSGLKALETLGLIDIDEGRRARNVFRFSNRWRTIDAVEAARLIERPVQHRAPSLPTMPWQAADR